MRSRQTVLSVKLMCENWIPSSLYCMMRGGINTARYVATLTMYGKQIDHMTVT